MGDNMGNKKNKDTSKQLRLNLYWVDMKYIRDLHNADDKVRSVSPQQGKQNRTFIGIVVVCKEHQYIIPLSHPKKKHQKMKPSADFDKIYDKRGRLIAVLNFNEMIPVTEKQLINVDFTIKPTDSQQIKAYKDLCRNEIEYCRNPRITKIISDKANTLYDLCTKENDSDDNTKKEYKGKSRCVDFKKLEKVCIRYNEKHYNNK